MAAVHLVDRHPGRFKKVQYRPGLPFVGFQARLHNRFPVVSARHQSGAIQVAQTSLLRRIQHEVIHATAGDTLPPSRQARDNLIVNYFQVNHQHLVAPHLQAIEQPTGLRYRPRKPVKDVPARVAGLADGVLQHLPYAFIRHQRPGREPGSQLCRQLIVAVGPLPQQLPGRDVRKTKPGAEQTSLRALT